MGISVGGAGVPAARNSLRDVAPEAVPVVRQYLMFVNRRRTIILGAAIVALLAAALVTLLSTRKYTAVATIEIAREASKIVDVKGVDEEVSSADVEFYQTQYGLLRSRKLAERVATKLGLADNPGFFESFGENRSELFPKEGPTPAAKANRVRLAGEILLKNVSVNPARLSRLVEISATAPDATLAAQIANAWTNNFIETTLERRFEAASYARTFLESRLDQIRRRLEDSERRLVQYAQAQKIVNLPIAGQIEGRTAERSLVADDLAQFNSELAVATAERIKAASRDPQTGQSGTVSEALNNSAINGLRQKRAELSADYQKLIGQFGPDYPPVQSLATQIAALDRSISREEGRVQSSLATTYRQAVAREQMLNQKVGDLKNGLLDQRRRSIQYAIFQRDVDTNRQLYDGLLQRYKEIGVAGGVGTNNVSLVDPADAPKKPSSPRLLINLLVGFLIGSAIGIGLAIARDQIDEAIGDPADIERRIGLPLLGAIPQSGDGDVVDMLSDPKSTLVEAYLSVKTSLDFATDHGLPKTICITSTRASEGKSTTALALAILLARSGKSVALVDGDMRSPSVHGLLGLGNDAGLSNVLAGDGSISQKMHRYDRFALSVMTAGPPPPNAAELLASKRLHSVIADLAKAFDHIVIDAPPVLGLADALLIGSAVDGTIFALKAHSVRANLAQTALARLASAHVRVLGCVFTMMNVKKSASQYGYDYGYSYGRTEESRAA